MVGQSQTTRGNIALSVNHSLKLFKALVETLQDHSQRSIAESSLARFKLWAGSLGAHRASGSRSLDYRLRDASFIRNHIRSLLEDLVVSLQEGISSLQNDDGASPLIQDSDSTLDELAEYFQDDDEEDEMEKIMQSIDHVISCLLRLSVTIRNPAPHDQFRSRAGKDIIDHFMPWDFQHVRTKFPELEDTITKRLALATGRRRQYFKYRAEHSTRLAEGLEINDAVTIAQIGETATTVASSLPDHLKETTSPVEPLEDNLSEVSGTSYATSAAGSLIASADNLRVPPIPPEYEDGPFKCPFCHMIIQVSNRSDWKRHVFGDLQPYVCLVSDCSMPDHLYTRRSHWLKHMRAEHWRTWHCSFGCQGKFDSETHFRAHMKNTHNQEVSDSNIVHLASLSSNTDDTKARGKCPLCTEFTCNSAQQYERHVGRHMEGLALFTLPNTGQDEDSDESDDSNAEDTADVEQARRQDMLDHPVWQGTVTISPTESFSVRATYVGGADFERIGRWEQLIPPYLTIAGQINQQSAQEYLGGLQLSTLIDVSVVNLVPTGTDHQQGFSKLVERYLDKPVYAVIGNKIAENVRDTYLVVLTGDHNRHPAFLKHLMAGHPSIESQGRPVLLGVFVYRNVPELPDIPAEGVQESSSQDIADPVPVITPKEIEESLLRSSVDSHSSTSHTSGPLETFSNSQKPDQKRRIKDALRLSEKAVELDKARDYKTASIFYVAACSYLEAVKERLDGPDDGNLKQLQTIIEKYQERIREISLMNLQSSTFLTPAHEGFKVITAYLEGGDKEFLRAMTEVNTQITTKETMENSHTTPSDGTPRSTTPSNKISLDNEWSPPKYNADAAAETQAGVSDDVSNHINMSGSDQSKGQTPEADAGAEFPASISTLGSFSSFLERVQDHFRDRPEAYKQFLHVLSEYEVGKKPPGDTYAQAKILLETAPDLVREFKQHLIIDGNAIYLPTEPDDQGVQMEWPQDLEEERPVRLGESVASGSRLRVSRSPGPLDETGALYSSLPDAALPAVFKCDEPGCGQQFDQLHKLMHHQRYHGRDHKCPYPLCDKAFGTKTHLKRHIGHHAPPMAPFQEFDFENFVFGPGSTINNEISSTQPFDDTFGWLTEFENQMSFQTNENVVDRLSPSAISTTSQSGISDVMVRHEKVKSFHCPIVACVYSRAGGEAFPRKDNWIRHMTRIHGLDPENLPEPVEVERIIV